MVPRSIKAEAQIGDVILKSAVECGRNSLAQSVCTGTGSASPSINRHVTMIKACSRENNLQGALDVFDRLKDSGAVMNSMAYNSLLDTCLQCQDTARALELFEQMKADKFADVVSFNIMLKMHLKEGKREKAQHLLAEMRTYGLQANKITYNELINAEVEAGDRRRVWELVA